MALVHEFESSGYWLSKRKSWLPLFIVVPGIFLMYIGNRQAILFDMRDELIFLGVSLVGEVIRIWATGFASKNAIGQNGTPGQSPEVLDVTGINSIVRHPRYLGNFFIGLGPVLFLRSIWCIVGYGLLFWLFYERIMFAEEQVLRRKFGEAYDKWSQKTGSFVPYSLKVIRSKQAFSLRNVISSENNNIFRIFTLFTLLDFFRNYFLRGKIRITGMWLYIFAGAFLVWVLFGFFYRQRGRNKK